MTQDPGTTGNSAATFRLRAPLSVCVAIAVLATVVTITVSRPDDSALFHSARSASDWGHHVIRLERAEALAEKGAATVLLHPGRAFQWLIDGDHDFPPLLHATAAIVGLFTGHDSATAQRWGLLWWLLLALATGWVAWTLADPARAGPNRTEQPASSSRLAIAAAAATAAGLIPAHHAAALNYYYDLPMTALLWSMAAGALALQGRGPVLPGLVGGVGSFVSGLMKWTALPASAPLLLGVLATPPAASKDADAQPTRILVRTRLLTGIVAAATCLVLLLLYWRRSPRSWNRMLSMTYGSTLDPRSDFPDESWFTTVANTLGRGLGAVSVGDHIQFESILWYAMHFVFSFLSPLLTVALVLLAVVWLRGGARGAPLVATVTAAHGLLLLAVFTSLDERFLLSLGPIAALVAAFGWSELPRGVREAGAVVLVTLGLWTAWDFHHAVPPSDPGPGADAGSEPSSTIGRIWAEIEYERSGLGLQSAVDTQWGWVRGDAMVSTYFPGREFIWSVATDCGATVLLAQDTLMTDGHGDTLWWTYRTSLSRLHVKPPTGQVLSFDGADIFRVSGEEIALEQAVAGDLVLAISRGGDRDAAPDPLSVGWQLRAVVDRVGTEGPRQLRLWTPVGSSLCPQWEEGPVRLTVKRLPEPQYR